MIGIKMKPNIPVHYQKGGIHFFSIFYFYFICTKIVLQEKIIPPLLPPHPKIIFFLFFISSPDPKGQVSYCHHWVKPLGQFEPNFDGMVLGWPPFCVQWSWLPIKMAIRLKIEKREDEILIVHCCFSICQNELKF
jgi:hypothetical protein